MDSVHLKKYFSGGTLVLFAIVLIATCGGSADERPWETVSSRITGQALLDGHVAGFPVRVTLDESVSVLADRNGQFLFPLVPPGTHLLKAQGLALRYQGQTWVTTRDGETTQVDLDLIEYANIGATVGSLTITDIPGLTAIAVTDTLGEGDILILCDTENGFEVVDIFDPTEPLYLGRSDDGRIPSSGELHYPVLVTGWRDHYNYEGGIAVYDLVDPSNPVKVSEVITDNKVYAVDWEGEYVYTLGSDFFQVYTVADLNQPALAASLPYSGEGVVYRDGMVYLSTDGPPLVVVDVSDPTSPAVAWEAVDTGEYGRDIGIDGEWLYVATSDKVLLYNVRDPVWPRLVNVVDEVYLLDRGAVFGGAMSLAGLEVDQGRVYLGAQHDGLQVLDYSDLYRPQFAWGHDGSVPFAMNNYISGSHIYVAARTYGMRVVRIK